MQGSRDARPLVWTNNLLVTILEDAWGALERRMWENALRNGAARKEEIHAGSRLVHKAIGPGVVSRLDGKLVYIDFGAGERCFQLPEACAKGLFLKISDT